jgi:geranylgeranyl reductase family protein
MPNPNWNLALDAIPEHCDVLVVGAGPAGSACARLLALGGLSVVLVDAQAFPRDKVCGDGLVPDSHAALRRLDVHAEVMRLAHTAGSARCVAPNGGFVDIAGELAVLPRRELDALLCRAALAAGALMAAPVRFEAPLTDAAGRVNGARLSQGVQSRQLGARWVVLATGALPAPLLAAGLCERRTPSGMALRAHVRHPGMDAELRELRFVWHSRLRGGYGWIFPGPDSVFNIGVGLLDGRDAGAWHAPWRRRRPNLRHMFDAFLQVDPLAARLMRDGELQGELKGAPMRCDLVGAQWSRPGLLVTGEAAGATYAFTGEGIGKAMETGMAAADALLAHAGLVGPGAGRSAGNPAAADAATAQDYQNRLEALLPKFQTYRQAASFNRWPGLVNLIIWRAGRSPRIAAKLGDVLNERRLPGSLLTLRGLRNMLTPG